MTCEAELCNEEKENFDDMVQQGVSVIFRNQNNNQVCNLMYISNREYHDKKTDSNIHCSKYQLIDKCLF